MSSLITTDNGLKLVYTGEFENDPSADTIKDLADNFNDNMEELDLTTSKFLVVEQKMAVVASTGLLARVLYGGSF